MKVSSTTFEVLTAVLLNIQVFWDVTPKKKGRHIFMQRHSATSIFISAINLFSFFLADSYCLCTSGENMLLRITSTFLTDKIPFHCTDTMEHSNELNCMPSIYCLPCLTGQ
jgi:hypothetical protein